MVSLETLPAVNPIDFALSSSPEAYTRTRESSLPWSTAALVNDILSPSHYATKNSQGDRQAKIIEEDIIFPCLPPLHHGYPDVHLRNGIINASRLAAAHVLDAERAFFVADLSQVYQQHKRWKTALPEIMPFYGVLDIPISCSNY